MKLENKIVVITGAGGIICSEFAKVLANEGAKVALLDINYDAAKKYADEIGNLTGTRLRLADDAASGFVTGTVIPVDGGFSAYSEV